MLSDPNLNLHLNRNLCIYLSESPREQFARATRDESEILSALDRTVCGCSDESADHSDAGIERKSLANLEVSNELASERRIDDESNRRRLRVVHPVHNQRD